ncbi:hypothetical protein [Pseudoroseicyclus sp. CXY001]|uniref:hypothetical protein n=1 Tax=Pseudoroseicyclus sp. CXY001 TaxID=3242492 RepID=UPI0035716E11
MLLSLAPPLLPRSDAGSLPRPPAVPARGPLLLSDAATPLGGETLLSLIWKRMEKAED